VTEYQEGATNILGDFGCYRNGWHTWAAVDVDQQWRFTNGSPQDGGIGNYVEVEVEIDN